MASSGKLPGDGAGCSAAFEQELSFVYRSLRRHGVQAADAEDLTQEVLLVMWRRWGDYDRTRPLRPWLAGIVLRVARRWGSRTRPEVPRAFIEEVDAGPPLEEQIEAGRERELALRALATLGEGHRAALVLHDLEGLALDEVAGVLGVPRSTAFSRLQAARVAFSRSVRRLEVALAAGRRVPSAAALLAAERAQPPLPEEVRKRALKRARALLLWPARPDDPGLDRPAPWRPSRWPVAAAALLSASSLVLLSGSLRGQPGARPPEGGSAPLEAAALDPSPSDSPRPRRLRPPVMLTSTVLKAPAALATPTPATLARGMVGYWRLDGNERGVAADRSGNGNDCVLRTIDPSRANDRKSGALVLAKDGWLECPASASLARPTAELTVAARVRRSGDERGVQTLLARQQAGAAGDDFFLGIFHRGDIEELVMNSRSWMVRISSPLPEARRAQGRWHHLAGIHAHDGTTTLFVDGQRVATGSSKRPEAVLGGTKPFLIGGGANREGSRSVDQLFRGEIDDLVIYARALDEGEIAALAAGMAPATVP